jgi:hypothetical protein
MTVGAFAVVAARPWPGAAVAISPDAAWAAIALPGRVVVAGLPHLDRVREVDVSDVRSLVALDGGRLALAPRRGFLVIDDPAGAPRVGVRARGPGRLALAVGPEGRLAAVGERAALPRATVVARSDAARRRDWTAAVPGATSAAWLEGDDLAVAAGDDLVLVRAGQEEARLTAPLGERITALAAIPGGVAIAGAGPRALLHSMRPGAGSPVVEVPPGVGRTLGYAGGLLVCGTRSLGERVVVIDLATGAIVHEQRGASAGALALGGPTCPPGVPLLVASGREGTVVIRREEPGPCDATRGVRSCG